MDALKTIELPYPESNATHTVFYKMDSALEVKVYNLPLAATDEDLKNHLSDVFSIFGHIEEVLLGKLQVAIVKFQTEKGLKRALAQKKKHSGDIPFAIAGQFGIERYLNKYHEVHPTIDALERVSSEFIAQFEEKEKEIKSASSGRKTIRLTEAEQREWIENYQKKAKEMQSADFYGFQQRNRPSLATELLSNDPAPPRHMKKTPKVKKIPQTQQNSKNSEKTEKPKDD